MWRRLQSLFPRNRTSTFGDCITVDAPNNRQTICGIFEEDIQALPIAQFLHAQSGIPLMQHDSDMRFGGTYYYHGRDSDRSITSASITINTPEP